MAKTKHHCAYEHLGGCSDVLNSRVDYWMAAARARFGRYAYYCTAHTRQADHLSPQLITFEPRYPLAEMPPA